jgi:hypothetical protein
MYESMKKEVDWEGDPPKGLIIHSSAFDESGNSTNVVDIWDSEQDLNNFVSNRLIPVMQKHDIPIPPKPEISQIHNINAYTGIDKYRK